MINQLLIPSVCETLSVTTQVSTFKTLYPKHTNFGIMKHIEFDQCEKDKDFSNKRNK